MFRTWAYLIRSLFKTPRPRRCGPSRGFRLELLEDRWVPASVQFNTASETIDESAGTFSIPVTLTGSASQLTVSTFANGFSQPEGFATDSSGNLYVANYDNDSVSKITPAGVVSGFAAISDPEGMAFDSAGNLYVASIGSNSIEKVTPSGGSALSSPISTPRVRCGWRSIPPTTSTSPTRR